MRWTVGTAFVIHMALLYSVASNMFFHRRGYLLNFPDLPIAARVERLQVVDVACICPRDWAERQRHRNVWICLESTCLADRRHPEAIF